MRAAPAGTVGRMNVAELINLHLRLECKAVDQDGDLVPIPCPNPDPIPRFYIAQHADDGSYSRFVRHDVPRGLREALLRIDPEVALHDHARMKEFLAPYGACEEMHYGKSYICPEPFPEEEVADVVQLGEEHGELMAAYDPRMRLGGSAIFAVVAGGRIVSTCESAREDDRAAECWVRTLPEYRGRGYARQTTAAWVNHALAHGRVAFYSHRMDNVASDAVARSLGCAQFITDTAYQ